MMKFCLFFLITSCFFICGAAIEADVKKERLVLITGCARSGTVYTAKILLENGLEVGHEIDGKAGIVSWLMATDTDKGFSDKPGANDYHFQHVFHQVRHPLQTISSVNTFSESNWKFIRANIPEISVKDPKLVRAAKFWYYWNLMAEKKAEMTYRVEDIENVLDEISLRLGVKLDKEVLKKVPKNIHTRRYFFKRLLHSRRYYYKKYTWADLKKALDPDLYDKIVELARRYGYSDV